MGAWCESYPYSLPNIVRGLDLELKIYFVSIAMGKSIKPAALVVVSPPSIQFFVCRTYKVETRS